MTQFLPEGHRQTAGDVHERERRRHGGIKAGSAFFGFLVAGALLVLLTAGVTAGAAALGSSLGFETEDVEPGGEVSTTTLSTLGIVGALVLLVVVFTAYWCGGYVAGRMARFDGGRQGAMVWAWAVLVAVVVAATGATFGEEIEEGGMLGGPLAPTTAELSLGIGALALVALVALAGAIVGGKSGMRFHRRVDRTGAEG